MRKFAIMTLLLCVVLALGCNSQENKGADEQVEEPEAAGSITITSAVFENEGEIPSKYTCDGEDISPPLEWADVPEEAKSLALICDDPDAPKKTWVHWVAYNIPVDSEGLPEAVPAGEELEAGGLQGANSWPEGDNVRYGGPCPPSGTHRYFFKLYALDTELDLEAGATKEELLAAMEGHVLDSGQIMGTYIKEENR